MKHSLFRGTIAAALTLSAVTAYAGCANPLAIGRQGALETFSAPIVEKSGDERSSKSDNAGRGIVGTWHVTYTAGGAPFGEAFIQWHSDGTEWENINFPVLGAGA